MSEIDGSGLNLDPTCELFKNGDPSFHSMTVLSKWGWPFGICTIGWLGIVFNNMQNNRPLYTGSHRYGLATVIGMTIGILGNKLRYSYMAEKDFQFYHYMTLHPEDFPAPERVKYKNYLTTWVPWR